MNIAQFLLSGVLLLSCGQFLRAEGFALQDLNPFSSREADRPADYSSRYSVVEVSNRPGGQSPSLWGRVQQDLRRLNNGTKRALSNTADALCWKNWGRSSPPPAPSRTSTHTWRTPSAPPRSNNSWFTPFWSREEPPQPRTPQDFVGMERPRM